MNIIAAAILLLTVVKSFISFGAEGSCTINFVPKNVLINLSATGQGAGGAMGKMKKKMMMPFDGFPKRKKQQSLFTHQMFNCTGKVTQWIFAAAWKNGGDKTRYPELQIWRPQSPGSTIYNKINSTRVTALSNTIDSIYTHDLSVPLNVINGDILGAYQPDDKKSRLVLYFQKTKNEIDSYYYKDKIDQSMSQFDVSGIAKNRIDERPLITAIIDISETTSSQPSTTSTTTSSVPITATSSSTTTTTTPQSSDSSSNTMSSASSQTHDITTSTDTSVLATSSHSIPSPTTTSTKLDSQSIIVKVTTTSIDQTKSSTSTQSYTNHQKTKTSTTQTTTKPLSYSILDETTSNATTLVHPTNICSNHSITLSSTGVLNNSCVSAESHTNNDNGGMSTPTIIIIVLVIVFATIFTFGMMIITVCALYLVVVFFKKKRENVEVEMLSCPAVSEHNRYIQKSVSSTMYESVAEVHTKEIELLSINQPPANTLERDENNHNSSVSSVDSSCPSVTVQSNVVVNTARKHYYDHLIIEQSGSEVDSKWNGSRVSPYEMPIIVPDENQSDRNIPVSFYDLADEIYVPTENQRLKIADKTKDYDCESLYKSLYKAQHDTTDNEGSMKHPEFFKESKEYWKPSYSKHAIYQQLANKRFREVPRHKIQVIEYLGSGQFATVNKAMWKMAGGDVEVAVKMIKEGAPEDERIKFLQEAAINGQFHHLNVVRLLGVVTVGEPTMIILELLRNGNLKKFLIAKRPKKHEIAPSDLPALLLNFSKQISSGMEYLSKKTFVHRDVAARNILVSDQLICKVADFGMSRDLEDNNYYVSKGGLVPIKWTAPEALYYRKYSAASDVWSYGVLLFEIWSLGKKPFSSVTNEQYIEEIDEGKRLPPPPGCPKLLYQLMIECWQPEPSERPKFTDIFRYLKTTSQKTLLSLDIADDELVESPNCDKLGASLECAHTLFLELQMKYLYED